MKSRDASARARGPLAGLLLLCTVGAAFSQPVDLYRGQTIVTGQGEESREAGFAEAFRHVLVAVSGDPRLVDDKAATLRPGQTTEFVTRFRYRDRMSGIPVHDEQGTRDRPYDLTVDFAPAAVDGALRGLGRKPWGQPRPRLLVFVDVQIGGTDYVLASDGGRGRDQREALAREADRLGMPAMLPNTAALAEAEITGKALMTADLGRLDRVAKSSGGDLALVGALRWSDTDQGWLSDWRVSAHGAAFHWQRRGGSFDQAFRSGLGGAAQILSGNGQPN